jgi:hypothetical protein
VLARLIDERPAFDPRDWMAQLPPMNLYGALLFQIIGNPPGAGPQPAHSPLYMVDQVCGAPAARITRIR